MKVTLRKKLLFSAVTMFASLIAIEVCLHVGYLVVGWKPFPFDLYEAAILRESTSGFPVRQSQEIRYDTVVEVIHPYLGFVLDPHQNPDTSPLGFPEVSPAVSTNEEAITIAVFGGSFAAGVALRGKLDEKLQPHGIQAKILGAATGGYKQPQQLLTLAYLLSQKTKIDVVVNIDGFNEIALPPTENLPKGTNPFYPRSWALRATTVNDTDSLRQIGRIAMLRDIRRGWAQTFTRLPRYSISSNLTWRLRDKLIGNELSDLDNRLRHSRPESAKFLSDGPAFDDHALYSQLADHWASCSTLMKNLCDGEGIKYIHALQPNQYVEGSRTFTVEEKQLAFKVDHPYRPGVLEGYPKLQEGGQKLRERGVDFHDMTMIYVDSPEPIYQDDCCHPNVQGYELIAIQLAQKIADRVKGE
jgi:hypothetical protein